MKKEESGGIRRFVHFRGCICTTDAKALLEQIREQSAARKEKRRAERPAYRVETGANMVPWNSTSSEERDR